MDANLPAGWIQSFSEEIREAKDCVRSLKGELPNSYITKTIEALSRLESAIEGVLKCSGLSDQFNLAAWQHMAEVSAATS